VFRHRPAPVPSTPLHDGAQALPLLKNHAINIIIFEYLIFMQQERGEMMRRRFIARHQADVCLPCESLNGTG
jgi:hypothetical protein